MHTHTHTLFYTHDEAFWGEKDRPLKLNKEWLGRAVKEVRRPGLRIWWLEDRAVVRVVACDLNLLPVTKHLGSLVSLPRCGAEGQVERVRLKRCL